MPEPALAQREVGLAYAEKAAVDGAFVYLRPVVWISILAVGEAANRLDGGSGVGIENAPLISGPAKVGTVIFPGKNRHARLQLAHEAEHIAEPVVFVGHRQKPSWCFATMTSPPMPPAFAAPTIWSASNFAGLSTFGSTSP